MNPVHRGARADDRVQAVDQLVRMLLLEPAHQVDLRSYRPLGAGGRLCDRLDYELG